MKTPVFINNRNRVSTLKNLIKWLENKNVQIIVLDNDSTYPPLIEYYKYLNHEVVMLKENFGNQALYKWGGHMNYVGRYFIYTDSDLIPKEDCPSDLVDYLIYSKQKYPHVNKVGASLEIKDIPDFYAFKKDVINWESKYWIEELDQFYIADVDTTFAVYDKLSESGRLHLINNCLRTKRPYVMKHLPWYLELNALDEEEKYYIKSANALLPNKKYVGMWTQKHKNKKIYI